MIAADPKSPATATAEIDVVDTIAPDAFKRQYIGTNTPLLIRKVTAHWPEMVVRVLCKSVVAQARVSGNEQRAARERAV
jgi:hypothetical protein